MKFESAQNHWYLTRSKQGNLTWMPTPSYIQQAIRDINFLRSGPMPIETVRDHIAEKLSLTEAQKNVRDPQGFRIFHRLVNYVVNLLVYEKSPIPANQLIMTKYGLFTAADSEKYYVYFDIFRDVMEIPLKDVDIAYFNPGIGGQFRQLGYPNSFEARQLTPDDLLPIR